MIYTYSGEIKRDYTGADEVLLCKGCNLEYTYERLNTGCNFISSFSRKISMYICKCRLLKSSEVVLELCLHGTARWELHVSGSDSEFRFEHRACLSSLFPFYLYLHVSSAILESKRDQKLKWGERPCSKGELTCRKKMRDALRCSSWDEIRKHTAVGAPHRE